MYEKVDVIIDKLETFLKNNDIQDCKISQVVEDFLRREMKNKRFQLDEKLELFYHFTDQSQKCELEKLIKSENKKLKKKGYFDDMGYFYTIYETRPYIRLRYAYMRHLSKMGKLSLAVGEAEEIIKLNINDNMGVRYWLMKLYALLENLESAENLHNRYNDDSSVHFLLPLSVLYYKLDQMKKAQKYLQLAYRNNHYLVDFFSGDLDFEGEEIVNCMENGVYRVGGPGEMATIALECQDLMFFSSSYILWAEDKLSRFAIESDKGV